MRTGFCTTVLSLIFGTHIKCLLGGPLYDIKVLAVLLIYWSEVTQGIGYHFPYTHANGINALLHSSNNLSDM